MIDIDQTAKGLNSPSEADRELEAIHREFRNALDDVNELASRLHQMDGRIHGEAATPKEAEKTSPHPTSALGAFEFTCAHLTESLNRAHAALDRIERFV